MEKILGIDTGTNSIGWAIVQKDKEEYKLLDKGTNIFQEGVKTEKRKESSKAAERTSYRSTRKRYYRIKLRKIHLLFVLSANHLCPPLSKEDLLNWRLKKIYPQNELFRQWQQTDDKLGVNPYAYRHLCLNKKLDLTDLHNRYILGRALYHIVQRRGFLSNRKSMDQSEEGKVTSGISELSEKMENAGYQYLGDYFYSLYNKGEQIRNQHTARNEHYLKEFEAICDKQEIESDLRKKIRNAIFYQRPLKSQKGQVGHCVFEKNKNRCPKSHPVFEEFRMLCFLNSIKIWEEQEDETWETGANKLRPLNESEKAQIAPLFFRKSKNNFEFNDIAKKLAKKRSYGYYKDKGNLSCRFNYQMDFTISSCPVTKALRDIFGENWLTNASDKYTLTGSKTRMQVLNDIWHALFSFSDQKNLFDFAKEKMQLSEEDAKKFSEIRMPSDYASLSLKAMCKILPFLRKGLIYSHAVYLANLCEVMPQGQWSIPEIRNAIIEDIIDYLEAYDPRLDVYNNLEKYIKDYLHNKYLIQENDLKKLYHPSMIELYPKVRPNDDGIYQLSSPRTESIRNPMVMHSLFRLRKLINRLLKEGKIDPDTTIHIELARELNDANKRKALYIYEKQNQALRENARKNILEGTGKQPTETDILKYILWEEQKHECPYTGKTISITDFIGEHPKFDIEHTIPQSVGGDSTQMNLTLCDSHFNRDIKGTKIPSELANHDDILKRVDRWRIKYEELNKIIRKHRASNYTTKESKDKVIQIRNLLTLERDYWKGKYERFTLETVPEGFSRRQGVGNSNISKYALMYLKSVFKHVYPIKGITTSDFRKIWGIQDLYTKKQRINHVHHCIDAVVIACVGLEEYNKLSEFYKASEKAQLYNTTKAHFPKPWPTFVEDLRNIENEIFVYHYTPDYVTKHTKKKERIKGKNIYKQGDTARGSLHNETFYGAIMRDDQLKYVHRIELSKITEQNKNILHNIVDDTVREIILNAVKEKGLKQALNDGFWMNEEKKIPIKKVRYYAKSITRPLLLKKQRDLSAKEYKQYYNVSNDQNYMLALYIGTNNKGKEQRDFKLINMLEATTHYKHSATQNSEEGFPPATSPKGLPLAYCLKKGTMVMLYENSAEEIWNSPRESQIKRLYKITQISISYKKTYPYATIEMVYHEEARPSGEVKGKNGAFKQDEDSRPKIIMYHTQIKALVQGCDFDINELGEIKRLR